MKADNFWRSPGALAQAIIGVLSGDRSPWANTAGRNLFYDDIVGTHAHLLVLASEGSRFQTEFCLDLSRFVGGSLLPGVVPELRSRLFDVVEQILSRAHLGIECQLPNGRDSARLAFERELGSETPCIAIEEVLRAHWKCADEITTLSPQGGTPAEEAA